MGIFDTLDGVKPNEGRNRKLEDGDYVVVIQNCLDKISQETKHPLYIVEWIIAESSNPAFKPGDTSAWVQDMVNKGADETVAQFLCAGLGCMMPRDKEKIASEIAPRLKQIGLATISADFFKDKKIRVNVKTKKTKKGFDFRAHTFFPIA